MVRRHPFTLIELLIALALSVVLLTTLFGFYRYLATSGADLAERRQQTFMERMVQHRLTQTLMQARSSSNRTIFYIDDKENDSMKAGSLLFVFDRGVDLRPEFSYRLLCRLYVDPNAQLCLGYWPEPYPEQQGSPPFRHEVLIDQVDSLSFSLFSAPDLTRQVTLGEVDTAPPGQWLNEWPVEYQALPVLAQVQIERQGRQMTFAFPMLYGPAPIVYKE